MTNTTTIHVHKFVIETGLPGLMECACGWSSRYFMGTFTVENEYGKVVPPSEWQK